MKSFYGLVLLLGAVAVASAAYRGPVTIITRSEWGAADTKVSETSPLGEIVRIVISHTAGPAAQYDGSNTVIKAIQDEGFNKGYADGSYHFCVAPTDTSGSSADTINAAVYELRPLAYAPAVVTPKNAGTLSIALIGDYQEGKDTLTEATKNAVINLVAEQVASNTLDCETDVMSASDLIATAELSTGVQAFIPALRVACSAEVERLGALGDNGPPLVPIIIGAVAGAALLGGVGFFLYKKNSAAPGATEEPRV